MPAINYSKHTEESLDLAKSLEDYLEESGTRITPQRSRICKVLAIAHVHNHHPTAEEINAFAIGQEKSNSTTYRTLNILIEAGLVDSLDFRDGRIRYEIKPNVPHGHLVNQHTGEVNEFEITPVLARELAGANHTGLPMQEIHIVLHVAKEKGFSIKKQRI